MKPLIKSHLLLTTCLGLWLTPALPAPAADSMTRFDQRSGSKMRMEGTSTVHDWQAESKLIMGFLEVGPNFPTEAGKEAPAGKVEARGQASVTVHSLYSVKKDGSLYDDKMDARMRELLKETSNPTIVFRLSEMALKEAPKDKAGAYVFDAKGDLEIAGVTNKISMPVSVMPLGEKNGDLRLKISGSVPLKMTDFKIEPAQILFAKVGDEVTVKFDWTVGHKLGAASAAK